MRSSPLPAHRARGTRRFSTPTNSAARVASCGPSIRVVSRSPTRQLRLVLARYLDVPPAVVRYELGPKGKPHLSGDLARIKFNMAHSDGLALVAMTRDLAVGVDIERMRDLPDATALADHHFSERECSALRAAPPPQRSARFLRYWTRKEAVIKASGEGLSRALDAFDVDTAPSSITVRTGLGQPEQTRWAMQDPPGSDRIRRRGSCCGCKRAAALARAVDLAVGRGCA